MIDMKKEMNLTKWVVGGPLIKELIKFQSNIRT